MSSIAAREFHSRFARILAVRDAVFTESLGSLLSRADGAGLADATNYAILEEAKWRGLEGLDIRIRLSAPRGK
jgi:hypothetical protein